jgi:hypothetical protein
MTAKMHQIIAVEKGVKNRVTKHITAAYHQFQKKAHNLFVGQAKTYQKKDDDGVDLPDKKQLVQANVEEVLADIAEQMTELIDVVAMKDHANCNAKADVVVDGEVLLTGVPATHLLFLEKSIVDYRTAIDEMPTLDAAYNWTKDEASSLYKSESVKTTQMAKVQQAIVKYDATPEHPAQTEMITKDEVVGTWTTVMHSGAVAASRKKELVKRADTLLKAVKFAREEANSVEAPKKEHGAAIFNFLIA